ncbi:uncharacterized protein K441DRAFT_729286 [Cenococcum geophilum 1.58]|uniref:uncharacterized protein n=1 Tax=Cenococcum geophilum 1.58 TaxID=794803 RepID=UPI00358FE878|nr:hypothetical protein K441DRAFT_729286 [Cenococcum geophilum 1.58]
MLPLALKGTHFLSLFIFSIFELREAAADHSGYDFLKLPPAELHDLHHSKSRVNYSTLGLTDWIHGTKMQKKVDISPPKGLKAKKEFWATFESAAIFRPTGLGSRFSRWG